MKISLPLAILATLAASSAHAWDCSYWSQSTNPAAECYKAPVAAAGNKTQVSNSNASNSIAGAASKANSAANASVSGVNSASSVGPIANGSASTAGVRTDTVSENSGNTTYRESANMVQPAAMYIQGCQVQGQAGGSNTRAAAMLGIGFTPRQCYDYIQAQAYLAIGARQAACEILNHTEAAQRAVKNGAVLPDCTPPAPPVAMGPPPRTYTSDEVNLLMRKALAK